MECEDTEVLQEILGNFGLVNSVTDLHGRYSVNMQRNSLSSDFGNEGSFNLLNLGGGSHAANMRRDYLGLDIGSASSLGRGNASDLRDAAGVSVQLDDVGASKGGARQRAKKKR